MKRIIINYQNLKEQDALMYVNSVISSGRISNGKKQYCYVTTFGKKRNIVVTTKINKTGTTDTFNVYKK